ncbi:putative isoprenylcysteine alpha-carbonyl methylesterase ICMEL2 [Glycine soja]
MEGENSLKEFSPEIKIQDPCLKSSIPHFPPVYLVHGTADYSIPSVASERFAEALKKAGVRAELILYEGKTHTDLFLQSSTMCYPFVLPIEVLILNHAAQDPLRGGKDDLFDLAVAIMHSNDSDALANDAIAPPRRRFVPEILLKLARKISPF